MRIPFVDLAAQRSTIAGEIDDAIRGCLDRNDWILGQDVAAFEEELAAYCGTAWAVGTDSGLSALDLTLRACGIGPGDEVITAANTFVATALAIVSAGATPVLVDADPETFNLDPGALEDAIGERTKAVMPVHLYGQPAAMDEISAVADRHGLLVVEDACQSHGARYKGLRTGSLGHAAAFSFYPSKNLGALGDAGAVVTSDEDLLDRLRLARNYGQRKKYVHEIKGFNRRLDTLQAAVLRVKLRHLDEWNDARRRCAALYGELLAPRGIATPLSQPWVEHVWHLYVIRVACRDELRAFLGERGIETGIHYPLPIHLQPAFEDLGYPRGTFPVTERLAGEILSLPMFPELDEAQIHAVADAVADFGAESLRLAPAPSGTFAAPADEPSRAA